MRQAGRDDAGYAGIGQRRMAHKKGKAGVSP